MNDRLIGLGPKHCIKHTRARITHGYIIRRYILYVTEEVTHRPVVDIYGFSTFLIIGIAKISSGTITRD